MGDGRVALILDVLGIARLSGVMGESRPVSHSEERAGPESLGSQRQSLLLFRSGAFERLAVPLSLVARLEEFPRSRIEYAAGKMVVQYREQILPLIDLAAEFGESGSAEFGKSGSAAFGSAEDQPPQDSVHVIVFADGLRRAGLLVDQILDIVEETVAVKKSSQQPGVLGSAVVGRQVTDFLDLHWVIERVEQSWFQRRACATGATTVMVTETSPFTRGLLRNNLEMAGHRVVEASSAGEALERLGRAAVDVVVTALDLPDRGVFQLLDSMGEKPGLRGIPVVALADTLAGDEGDSRFAEVLLKFDRAAMLRSVDRLALALRRADGEESGREEDAQESVAGKKG